MEEHLKKRNIEIVCKSYSLVQSNNTPFNFIKEYIKKRLDAEDSSFWWIEDASKFLCLIELERLSEGGKNLALAKELNTRIIPDWCGPTTKYTSNLHLCNEKTGKIHATIVDFDPDEKWDFGFVMLGKGPCWGFFRHRIDSFYGIDPSDVANIGPIESGKVWAQDRTKSIHEEPIYDIVDRAFYDTGEYFIKFPILDTLYENKEFEGRMYEADLFTNETNFSLKIYTTGRVDRKHFASYKYEVIIPFNTWKCKYKLLDKKSNMMDNILYKKHGRLPVYYNRISRNRIFYLSSF